MSGARSRTTCHPLDRQLSLAGVVVMLAMLFGCEFNPVARPVQREQLMDGPVRVLRTLDPYGQRVLLRYENRDGNRVYAISAWRADDLCDLPNEDLLVFDPLLRAVDMRNTAKDLLIPFARPTDGGYTLWLSDEHCTLTGPLAAINPDTRQVVGSADDQRDLFFFRDPDAVLYLLDTANPTEVVKIAENVQAAQMGTTGTTDLTDALWIREGTRLTQRALDGTLLVELGDAVTAFALYQGVLPRVAFVDGGDLYEAVAPTYQPTLRAEDACTPVYNGSNLELYVPCDARQLVRVELSSGKIKEFADDVFFSVTINELQFDYARVRDAQGEIAKDDAGNELSELYLQMPGSDGKRMQITPLLRSSSLVVLNQNRIAGQTRDGTFGIWLVDAETFTPLFDHVAVLVPLLDTRANEYIWLMHHDVENAQLGTLSIFTQTDLTLQTIATGVPTYASGGFIIDGGRAIPKFPYPEAILLFLEDAVPLQANPDRFKGRLRAQLLSGELGADLADNVTSYAIVATPLPGVLFGVEEGPNSGLWFAAL